MDIAALFANSVRAMHDLMGLFHRIYDVQGIITWGGLAALVLIIFAETGLLVGFFLPGDSLLVTAGIYCTAIQEDKPPLLSLPLVLLLCSIAAVVGDTVGYWIGAKSGPALFNREQSLFFSRKHLLRTKEFYERHGGKTIVIARFMPFVRTFAPVVAGIGQMNYRRFLSFNVFGGIGWVVSMTMLGFSLSKVFPHLNKQIDKVIIVIIAVSLLPGAISWLQNRKKSESPKIAA
jgi:membrane-associated protein